MQQLDRSTEIAVQLTLVAERPGDEHQQCRTHTLAACTHNVLTDFLHARNIALELGHDDAFDSLHVLSDGRKELLNQDFWIRLGVLFRHRFLW